MIHAVGASLVISLWIGYSPPVFTASLERQAVEPSAINRSEGSGPGQSNTDSSLGCTSQEKTSCEEIRLGIKEFRTAQFKDALKHFRKAVDLDPRNLQAQLYVAMSYFQQYVPGGESEENLEVARQAIQAFESVLRIEPSNSAALSTLALIYYNMKDFGKAKEYESRRIDIEPKNPEPYYWIGVLDWSLCYPRRMQLRKELNLSLPPDPAEPERLAPLPEEARWRLMGDNDSLVSEGIENLEKAIEFKPDYDDAMAYLSLMYREKADLEAEDAARASDLEAARQWVDRALESRRRAAQRNSPTETPRSAP